MMAIWKNIFVLLVFLLVILPFVQAAYSASSSIRYINRSAITEINISIVSDGNGSRDNLTIINITLPNGFVFISGTNRTNAGNFYFYNSSNRLTWNSTAGGIPFPNNSQKDFRFNVTSPTAGDGTFIVNASQHLGEINSSIISITTNFDFAGYIVNSTGNNESNVNVSFYQFVVGTSGPPLEVYEKSVITNANGSFSFASVNGSATNYLLKMVRYGSSGSGCISSNSSCTARMTGTVLPPFPTQMFYPLSEEFDFSLNGSTFYLQDAATLRLYANGLNTTGNMAQQRFGYQVIDQKIGFPIASNLQTNVSTVDVVVPSGKSYSVMFMRDFSTFGFSLGCNGSVFNDTHCPNPPITNSSLGTITAGDVVIVNQSLAITRNRLYGCINVATGYNTTALNVTNIKLKMIPFTTSAGSFVPEFNAGRGDINISKDTELNATNSTGVAVSGGVLCPGGIAAYNLSVLGSASGISYFIEIYAKNASLVYENATHVGGNYLAGFLNVTITADTPKNITLYKLLGSYINDSTNAVALNTSLMKINIQNETGGAVTSDMHVDVSVKNSNAGIGKVFYMVETLTNGTFYIPMLNNSDYAEVSVYPNDAPPMKKKLNLSLSENNVTLVSIEFGGEGDKGLRQVNASGQLEQVNFTAFPVQLRFLRRGTTSVITEMNASRFNPLKALVAGQVDLELKVLSTNVTMRFNNFDMFSAKQPPMFAVMDDAKANSSSQNWKFGNFVPKDVYDNVTLIIPYSEGDITESGDFNISIPILYTEDPSEAHQLIAAWNRTRGDSYSNLTDEFIAYNASRYRDYLTAAGINCSKSVSTHVCFINTSSNEITMEIPHFSGVLPTMAVTTAASSSSSSSSGGGSGGGIAGIFWTGTQTVLSEDLETGVDKTVQVKHRLKLNVSGETHYVGVVEINNSQVTINVSSDPVQEIFSIGEEKKFELTGDNYYDLSVKVNGIEGHNKVNLIVKKINEEIPQLLPEESVISEGSLESESQEQPPKAVRSSAVLYVAVIVIAIVIIVAIIFFRRLRRD